MRRFLALAFVPLALCVAGCGDKSTKSTGPAGTPVSTPSPDPTAEPGSGKAEILWRGDRWCSAKSPVGEVGVCAGDDGWDVTACVDAPGDGRPWSLRADAKAVARFEVRPGDQGAKGGGDRCEIIKQTRPITGMEPAPDREPTPGGEVRLFGFEARYDESLQRPSRLQYQTVGQWHQSTPTAGCPGSSPLIMGIAGPTGAKRLDVQAQQCVKGVKTPRKRLFSAPLTTDVWHEWLFEIKWSTDPEVGYVRITHDGEKVVGDGCDPDGRCAMATQYSGRDGSVSRNHFKLGNYRDKSIAFPTVVSYRNVWIGVP